MELRRRSKCRAHDIPAVHATRKKRYLCSDKSFSTSRVPHAASSSQAIEARPNGKLGDSMASAAENVDGLLRVSSV
jgi:hypothetical protein